MLSNSYIIYHNSNIQFNVINDISNKIHLYQLHNYIHKNNINQFYLIIYVMQLFLHYPLKHY
jgi:hypothetical protein